MSAVGAASGAVFLAIPARLRSSKAGQAFKRVSRTQVFLAIPARFRSGFVDAFRIRENNDRLPGHPGQVP